MIITEKVEIELTSRNIKYYGELGYHIPREKDNRGRTRFVRGTKIEVLVKDLNRHSKATILCQCEICGKVRSMRYDNLTQPSNRNFNKNGTTLCQACSNHDKFYKDIDKQYRGYLSTSKYRNLSFGLTESQFISIASSPCYYCGEFGNGKFNGRNGIDRINNNIGYEFENCVSCCETCNKMKLTQSYDDFLSHIEKIYNNKIKDK